MKGFNKWLDTFVEEKEIDVFHTFEVITEDDTFHLIPVGAVMDYMKSLGDEGQAQVRKTIVHIDFRNGDVLHFFAYVAKFMAEKYQGVIKNA